MCKQLKQHKKYIAQKSKQLDNITDAHKYTRRLARVMKYYKLLTEIEVAASMKIIKGDGEMTTANDLIKDLTHFKGMVWISRSIERESRGNIYLENQYTGKYLVLAYIAPSELKNREVKDVARSIVVAQGLQKWLETIDESVITCSLCGLTLDESLVNITDYELDLCFQCEN